MLGSEISRQLKEHKFDFTGTDRNVDITDPAALEAFAESHTNADGTFSFDWIINCSAYTAVDRAEDDEVSAEKLNADGPRNIARVAQKIGAKLLHLSTDYVFDGTGSRPYRETDGRKPIGVYGRTKAAGEQAVLDLIPGSSYIIRTAWLAGYDGNNFVYTMTRLMNSRDSLTVVSDQHGTPTFAEDLASVIIGIIQRDRNGTPVPCGIYHCTDLGETNWYEFARAIYEKGRDTGRITKTCRVLPCTTAEYPTKAQRPAYSVLDKTKIQHALGITLPRWQDSLDRFMKSSRFRLPEK
jgi:dTDP-4-dehydrorhamnose reductase